MRVVRSVVNRVVPIPVVTRVMRRVLPPVDRVVQRLTAGRRTLTEMVFPTLVLTSTGRRTGRPRSTPLLYVATDAGYAVAATNWGGDAHPAWSDNLLAEPHARVTIDGRDRDVHARLVDEEAEQRRLWDQLDALYAGFPRYRASAAARGVRIFVLEPDPPA